MKEADFRAFEAILVYEESSRKAKDTQRNPAFKN